MDYGLATYGLKAKKPGSGDQHRPLRALSLRMNLYIIHQFSFYAINKDAQQTSDVQIIQTAFMYVDKFARRVNCTEFKLSHLF